MGLVHEEGWLRPMIVIVYLYSALFAVPGYLTLKAHRHGSYSFTCNYTNACLYLVSVHQMAPLYTEVADI